MSARLIARTSSAKCDAHATNTPVMPSPQTRGDNHCRKPRTPSSPINASCMADTRTATAAACSATPGAGAPAGLDCGCGCGCAGDALAALFGGDCAGSEATARAEAMSRPFLRGVSRDGDGWVAWPACTPLATAWVSDGDATCTSVGNSGGGGGEGARGCDGGAPTPVAPPLGWSCASDGSNSGGSACDAMTWADAISPVFCLRLGVAAGS